MNHSDWATSSVKSVAGAARVGRRQFVASVAATATLIAAAPARHKCSAGVAAADAVSAAEAAAEAAGAQVAAAVVVDGVKENIA